MIYQDNFNKKTDTVEFSYANIFYLTFTHVWVENLFDCYNIFLVIKNIYIYF